MSRINDEDIVRVLLHKTIKRHADLSDWDDENIELEVNAIMKALKRHGIDFVSKDKRK